MSDETTITKAPYNFGRAIFLPFQSGPGSWGFMLKSALFYTVMTVVIYLIFASSIKSATIDFNNAQSELIGSEAAGALASSWFLASWKLFLVSGPFYLGIWIAWAMIEAALHRRVLGEEPGQAFPWRFGADELRVMLCHLVCYFMYIVVFFVAYMVLAIILGGIGMMISPILGAIMIFLGMLGAVVISGALAIRFAPAAAMSVAQGKISLGAAWTSSKGRVWPSFGAYSLLWIVGGLLYFFIALTLMSVMFGSEFVTIFQDAVYGDAAASNAMYEKDNYIFMQTLQMAALSLFTVFLGLCITGVGTHIAALYRKDIGVSEASVFD